MTQYKKHIGTALVGLTTLVVGMIIGSRTVENYVRNSSLLRFGDNETYLCVRVDKE